LAINEFEDLSGEIKNLLWKVINSDLWKLGMIYNKVEASGIEEAYIIYNIIKALRRRNWVRHTYIIYNY